MARAEPERGMSAMTPAEISHAGETIRKAQEAGKVKRDTGVMSMFDPVEEEEPPAKSVAVTEPIVVSPEPEAPELEPAPDTEPVVTADELANFDYDPFAPVDGDDGKVDLPRRALRTDDKAWPGREKFEENKPGAEAKPRDAGVDAKLAAGLDAQTGFAFDVPVVDIKSPKLTDTMVVPPFTILDTKQDYWQARRRAWKTLGMRAETISPDFDNTKIEGNLKDGSTGLNGEAQKRASYNQASLDVDRDTKAQTGTSIFDPVLCELVYRWFSAVGATVLDPFAGGAVRGIMAGVLGRQYYGIELRPEQVADNRAQSKGIEARVHPDSDVRLVLGRPYQQPVWIEGDATQLRNISDAPAAADLLFTCPPYADLEVYSRNPRDLSTSAYATFRALLAQALACAAERLKQDRFAVVVLGEARHVKSGMPYDLITDAKLMARELGMPLYNEAILANSIGTAAQRAAGNMKTRKLVRIHQHVLCFVKGDPKKAAAACGTLELDR